MSTKKARTLATQRWRQRTQQKLVQVYLHTYTVSKLDQLVTAENASGRAAVITRLVQDAAACIRTDTVETQQSDDPWLDADDPPQIPRTDDGCMASTTRGHRCKGKGAWWRRVELRGHGWQALVCKRHQKADSITLHSSNVIVAMG